MDNAARGGAALNATKAKGVGDCAKDASMGAREELEDEGAHRRAQTAGDALFVGGTAAGLAVTPLARVLFTLRGVATARSEKNINRTEKT